MRIGDEVAMFAIAFTLAVLVCSALGFYRALGWPLMLLMVVGGIATARLALFFLEQRR